ncbi:hypothetical protein [Polynucleobacter sp. AP-Feld-500C-C5]|uniref:hypothetical protein n=1 Tax=Polynucleobacter sp. AP-Feld-500C-C5 TaxID=2576924 RepID=UPI001C0E838D|nr:hypothetical protein [Polynucleobacter sp. AP-Feld-500C-C5]MBU3631699.1 hypothetical protein [Polynucleobacter sp. AP-Feld-500C-C5]
MKLKLFLILIALIPTLTMAQSSAPAGVDAERYTWCMKEGLGDGRSYATPQSYCQQWAGPSASSSPRRERPQGVGGVPCGFNIYTGQMIFRTKAQCEEVAKLPEKYRGCRNADMPLQQCMADIDANAVAQQRRIAVNKCLAFNQSNWLKQYSPYGTLYGPGEYSYAQWQGFVEYWCETKPSFNLLGG